MARVRLEREPGAVLVTEPATSVTVDREYYDVKTEQVGHSILIGTQILKTYGWGLHWGEAWGTT